MQNTNKSTLRHDLSCELFDSLNRLKIGAHNAEQIFFNFFKRIEH